VSSPDEPTRARYRNALILALIIAIAVGFVALVRHFILAVVMAFIFSSLLWPVYLRVRSWLGGRRALASATVLVAAILVVGLPVLGILALVATEAIEISNAMMPWFKEQMQSIDQKPILVLPDWLPWAEEFQPFQATVVQTLGEHAGNAANYLVRWITRATQGVATLLINLFVMIYAMFFFLMHGQTLLEGIVENLPLGHADSRRLLNRGLEVTKATLKSTLVIGFIQGALVGLAFWIAGLKGAAFWGALVLVLSAIPGLGAPVVWVPAAIYLFVDGRVVTAVLLAIWGAAVVGLVDNILRPRLVGQETKLPDLLILVSTFGGIAAFGPLGIVLGPVIASIFVTALGIYREAFL